MAELLFRGSHTDSLDIISRFPSVPLLDLDQMEGGSSKADMKHLEPKDAWALPMPGLDGAKGLTITTGTMPGASCTSCDGGELAEDDSRSSMSLVKPLSSLESVHLEQLRSCLTPTAHAADEVALGGSLSPGSASAEESRLRRSSRNHGSPVSKPKEKRKVGRPIAYCGDPASPDLSPAERRRILRRIANRESARRVRARRQELLEDMAVKAQEIEDSNARLMARAQSVEHKHQAMAQQVGALRQDLSRKHEENAALLQEVSLLRKSLSGGSSQQSIDKDAFRAMAAEQRALASPFGAASYADEPYTSAFQPGSLPSAGAAGISGPSNLFCPAQPGGVLAAGECAGAQTSSNILRNQLLPTINEPSLDRSFSDFLKDVTAVGGA